MAQQTAMQKLWDWIDANCHEDNFNLNDAREMSLKLEKEQIIDAANQNQFEDVDGMGICDTITKGEQYYSETYGK